MFCARRSVWARKRQTQLNATFVFSTSPKPCWLLDWCGRVRPTRAVIGVMYIYILSVRRMRRAKRAVWRNRWLNIKWNYEYGTNWLCLRNGDGLMDETSKRSFGILRFPLEFDFKYHYSYFRINKNQEIWSRLKKTVYNIMYKILINRVKIGHQQCTSFAY